MKNTCLYSGYSDICVPDISASCNFGGQKTSSRGLRFCRYFQPNVADTVWCLDCGIEGNIPPSSPQLWFIHSVFKANKGLTSVLVVWWLSLLNEAFPLFFYQTLIIYTWAVISPPNQASTWARLTLIKWRCECVISSLKNHPHPFSYFPGKGVHWHMPFGKVFAIIYQELDSTVLFLSIHPQWVVPRKVLYKQRCLMQHYLR